MGSKNTGDRVVLPLEVVPVHYDLTIEPKLEEDFMFQGTVAISLNLRNDSFTSLTLHSKELKLNSCTYTAAAAGAKPMTSTKIEYDEKATTVTISFSSNLPDGDGTLLIQYTGCHNNQMAGFYRSGYFNLKGEKKTMVSTQLEPLDARRCFPCIDEPARKAEFTCTLIVDKNLVALSNMPVETSEPVKGTEKNKIKFRKSPKMSTYLLAFCLGEFDFVETTTEHGVLLRVYTPPGKKHLGEFALQAGAKALDLYDNMFGLPFPLPKMDMIGIPEFAMGAMENWGLVTYREVDILIDAVRASSQQKQRVCSVVAHELAHQWFGNLVTMAWWDDLWLNEGFASWMQNYASDYIYPDWKLWEQFVIDEQAAGLGLDALASSHPIQVPIKHAEEVEEVFDAISYRKGASIVRLIHAYLGHDLFVKGLQLYMERHQYGNTETHNLWNAWETASGGTKEVSKVMASWTEQMGFPVITVTSISEKDGVMKLQLEQRWFLADGSRPPESATKLWSVPMFASTAKGIQQLPLFTERKTEISVKVEKGKFVKLNGGQHVPIRVNYTEELWKRQEAAVHAGAVSVVDRCGLVMDAYALSSSGELDPAVLIGLLGAFEKERTYPGWVAVSGALYGLHKVLLEETTYLPHANALAAKLIVPVAKEVGWESTEADGHLGKMLRALVINLLARFAPNDPEVLKEARGRYEKYLADPHSENAAVNLPAEYRTAVLKIVLQNAETRKEFDDLMQLLDKLETTVEKKDIYLALGYAKQLELKQEVLEYCISGKIKLQDFFYPLAGINGSGVEGLNLSWEFLKTNFGKYEKMLETASPSLMGAVITYSASGFTSMEKAQEIEDFFKAHPTKVERRIKQLVEATRTTANFKQLLLKSTNFQTALFAH